MTFIVEIGPRLQTILAALLVVVLVRLFWYVRSGVWRNRE